MALSKDVNIPLEVSQGGKLMLVVNQDDFTHTLQFLTKQAVRVSDLGATMQVRARVELRDISMAVPESRSTGYANSSRSSKPDRLLRGDVVLDVRGALVIEVADTGMGLSEVNMQGID